LRTYILFLAICAAGCLSQDELPHFTSDELAALLASDSAKSWNLTGRFINGELVLLECEKDDLLTFGQAANALDTAKVTFTTGPALCPGQSDSIIFNGYWFLSGANNGDSLQYVINGDTSNRSIETITSQWLRLSRSEGPNVVIEEFVLPID